jgi:PEGA domain
MQRLVALLVVFMLGLWPCRAYAQPADAQPADAQPAAEADVAALQERGKAALKDGRLDEAVAIFTEGLGATDDEPSTWHMLLGLALAFELQGDRVASASYYQAFLSRSADHEAARSGRWASRRLSATEDIAKIEPEVLATHALVALMAEPTNAVVIAAGLPAGSTTPLTLYLSPGQHQLELTKPGYASMIVVVSVDKGQQVTVQRALVPLEVPPEPEQPPAVAEPAPTLPPAGPRAPRAAEPVASPDSPMLEVLGWSMAGVGLAGIGAGIGFTVAASSTASKLEDLQRGGLDATALADDARLRDELSDRQIGAAASYASGAALALGGALVLLLRPDGPLDVTPTVGVGFLGARGRF